MTNPGIGHNRPPFDPETVIDIATLADWLRETFAHKFARRDALLAGIGQWVENHTFEVNGKKVVAIADDADQAASTDQLGQILTEIDGIYGKKGCLHETVKAPFLQGGRIVDTILKGELADRLTAESAKLQGPMREYQIARAVRLQREAEEAAARAAADAAVAAASLAPDAGADDLDWAMEAEQAALDAQTRAATVKPSLVRGDMGTTAGLRGAWKAYVRDLDKLPRDCLMANMDVITAKMKSSIDKKSNQPTIKIPGVEFVFEQNLSVRR